MKYIGIDFGDGTTSVSLVNVDDKGNVTPPTVENIMNEGISGDKSEVPTILAYPLKNGRIDSSRPTLIGSLAAEASDNGEYAVRSNWKTKPTEPEVTPGYPFEERSKDAKNFMAMIWKLYQETNGAQGRDVHIIIGAPSGWKQKDRDEYASWAKAVGLPNVDVLSESTAASLYSRKFLKTAEDKYISDEALANGILLVDIGSSTIDFTFTKGLEIFPPKGYPIGAKYVDEAILKYNLERPGADVAEAREIINSKGNGEIKSRAQFYCRLLKENYFTTKAKVGAEAPIRVKARHSVALSPTVDFDIYIYDESSPGRIVSDSFWKSILEEGCSPQYKINSIDDQKVAWRVAFRDALKCVKKSVEEVVKPENVPSITIVLTGGASRMDFVDDDIRSVFGAHVTLCAGCSNDRAYSVAKGLAWAGYARKKIAASEKPILDGVNKFMVSSTVQNRIRNEILTPFAKSVTLEFSGTFSDMLRKKPGLVDTVGKQKTMTKTIVKKIISEKLMGKEFADLMHTLLVSLINSTDIIETTAELQREFARVTLPVERATAISGVGLSFNINCEGMLERWKHTALDVFLDTFTPLGFLGFIIDWLMRSDQTIVTNEQRDKQLKFLTSHPMPEKMVKEILGAFCKNNGDKQSNTLIQTVTTVMTDAIVKTKKNELDALAGQFSDAE